MLSTSRIRALPDRFKALKPQAQEATLSFLKGPERDADYGEEALDRFRTLTYVCSSKKTLHGYRFAIVLIADI